MESKELNLKKHSENGGSGGDGFIDRSKVRILLCDNDEHSSEEVFALLMKCSYQVISVRSPRQVIDALNAEAPDIDIILAEVDLPMRKGLKMLKYITWDRELRRIPVIMMSAQDEVSTVVKCLKLGAADYLVKPLRTNELLNLWTHVWRRRRMFSSAAAMEFPVNNVSEFRPDVPGTHDHQTGKSSSGPKKSNLKMGESSSFFTYVKSSTLTCAEDNVVEEVRIKEKHQAFGCQVVDDPQVHVSREAQESYSEGDDLQGSNSSVPDSLSLEGSCTPLGSMLLQHEKNFEKDQSSQVLVHPRNELQQDFSGLPAQAAYPYYIPGVVNQVMMSSSTQVHQKNPHDMQNHSTTAIMPQYSHLPHCPPDVTGMTPFPCYQLSVCLQPGQIPNTHPWPSLGISSSTEVKLNKVDRREAALIKFTKKRMELCFDKKIRYVNRKRLAERRPRVRGQFVRKASGVNLELQSREYSPEDGASGC
ncbi:hypothetical protein PRUPE_5G197900 [Prunus persica]|uniref:Two-component response regulator-like APRR1 n=1 Tax=Prunus persica TaxID=3760 RepID=M5WXA6_PRUPE|nr:two-component response regulator-like APRR1 [Prunus persica]ONI08736.1 hypothetical protein PRUPE_5G197900 [Prunus persica]